MLAKHAICEVLDVLMTVVYMCSGANTSVDFSDPGVADTHTAVWDWGDSSISEGIICGDTIYRKSCL